jgi:excisionase family DNA binding protein
MLARERQGTSRANDAELVERVLRRDQQAWRELVRASEPMLRALLEEHGALSASDVDDVVSELWLRVLDDDLRRLRQFAVTRPGSLDAWLAMQASQVAHAFVARRGPRTISIDDLPPIAAPPTVPRPAARMMKVEEVAERWDLNTKTVYDMIKRGELAARRCGRVIRVPRHVVESFEQASVAPGGRKPCR